MTTDRDNLATYRTAVNNEAQHEAETIKDDAARHDFGSQIAYLSQALRQSEAQISHVHALIEQWIPGPTHDATHSEFCFQFHPDCLVQRIGDTLR